MQYDDAYVFTYSSPRMKILSETTPLPPPVPYIRKIWEGNAFTNTATTTTTTTNNNKSAPSNKQQQLPCCAKKQKLFH